MLDQASSWTATRLADLKRMWAEGSSCRQIADVLGVTRNAVMGKIHRCGFRAPASKRALTANRPRRQAGWKPRQWIPPLSLEERARRQRERDLLRELTRAQPLPDPPPNHSGFLNLTFDQIQHGDCRYPTGREPPFAYCGQPALHRRPYCQHCFTVTHN